MVGKELGHLFGDLGNEGVFGGGWQGRNRRFFFCEFAEGAAVLVVEIPVAALRFALGIEEDVSFGAESAVVGLHQEMFFSLGPRLKLLSGHEELGTGMAVDGNSQFLGESGKGVVGIVLVGVKKVNFADAMFFYPLDENGGVIGLFWEVD